MCQYINLFSTKIGTFPLCIGLGVATIVFCIFFQLKHFKSDDEFENKVMICIPFSLIAGTLTGHISDILLHGGIKALLQPFSYGFTFYGWLLGCIIFYCIYAKISHLNLKFLLNLFLPSFALAQALGRIGCFFGGCCFGKPSYQFGVAFPVGSFPYRMYGNIPLFPVQLVESGYLILLAIFLYTLIRFRFRAGSYLIFMAAGRYFFEFLRGDNRGALISDVFSPSQIFSIGVFFSGVLLLYMQQQQAKYRRTSWKMMK